MKNQNSIALMAMACASLLALAACGSSPSTKDSGSGPKGSEAPAQSAAPAPAPAKSAQNEGPVDKSKVEGRTIRIVADPSNAPFEFRNENGQIEGLDVDIMNEIAKRKGFKIEYNGQP